MSVELPIIEKGTYRHYKGSLYEVLGVGIDTETEEPVVIYSPLYKSEVVYWVRPYKMFISDVEVDGQTIARFSPV